MQILNKLSLLLSFCILILLSGCDNISYLINGPSENRELMEKLPREEWISFAHSLNIPDRLDLYIEMKEYTGHPGDTTLVDAFSNEPQKTYDEIIIRLQNMDYNPNYLWLLKTLDRLDSFSICDKPNRKIIQQYLHKEFQNVLTVDPTFYEGIEFYKC